MFPIALAKLNVGWLTIIVRRVIYNGTQPAFADVGTFVMNAPKAAPRPAIAHALKLSFVDGEVVFLGDRIGFSMTTAAAAETSLRLTALLREEGGRTDR
jgi:hypothetical protein